MKEFQERKKMRRLLYSPLSVLVLLVIAFFVAKSAFGVYKKERESSERRAQAETALSALKVRRDALKVSVESLATPEGVEREIRENYRMVRPGEELIILTETPVAATATESTGFFGNLFKKVQDAF